MIAVRDAVKIIQEHTAPLEARRVAIDRCLHLTLAEDVTSAVRLPAFDKALMDGVALRSADYDRQGACFLIRSTIAAGDLAEGELAIGQSDRIMTGATLPAGADTVVPFEELAEALPNWRSATSVRLAKRPRPNANMLKRGELVEFGEMVLPAGIRIEAAAQAFLMELGLTDLLAFPRPHAAVLATGSELVAWPETPPTGSIRDTNGPMIRALLGQFGCAAENLGRANDVPASLTAQIQHGLHADLFVITGGVSVGDRDLVPEILEQHHVQRLFHGIDMKPGKPVWFGKRDRTYVVGLPGNPVSAIVGFHVLIRPLLDQLAGCTTSMDWPQLPLASSFDIVAKRETYLPAQRRDGQVQILPWRGSSDLRTLATATGLVRFTETQNHFEAGDLVPYLDTTTAYHGPCHNVDA